MSNFCSVNSSGLSRVLWCFPPFLTAFTSFCLPIYLWCCFNLDASGCFPFMESDSLLIRLKHSRATSRILDLEEISSICNNDIANAQTFHKPKKTWLISSSGKTTKLQASLCIYVHNLINMVTRLPPPLPVFTKAALCTCPVVKSISAYWSVQPWCDRYHWLYKGAFPVSLLTCSLSPNIIAGFASLTV